MPDELTCPKCGMEIDIDIDIETEFDKNLASSTIDFRCPICRYLMQIERETENFYYIKEFK